MQGRRKDRAGTAAPSRKAAQRALFGAALVTALVVAAPPASAFRPSGRWLLDQAAARQLKRGLRTLKVQQEAMLYGLETAPRGLLVEERTWLLAPDAMRAEVDLPEGTRILVRTKTKRKVQEPGKPKRAVRPRPDFVLHFLAAGAPLERADLAERLARDLKAMKVDLGVVSYARFDGRVAYVVGAKPWEADKPQVWLDKDSLLLLRVIEVEPVAGEGRVLRRELRLTGYGSPEGGSWFPKVIEEWEGDALAKRSVTREVDKNEPLDKQLFE